MYPILFSSGSFNLRSSVFFFFLGCVAGLIIGIIETKRLSELGRIVYDPISIWVFFLAFLPFVYLSGLVNTWIFNWDFYSKNLSLKGLLSSGWISYGGIIGALIFCPVYDYLYPRITKNITVPTIDSIALVLPIFEGVYRIGCLLNGCCYGMKTTSFLGLYLPDVHGVWAVRYPTQLFYILLGFGLFFLLWHYRKKKRFKGELVFLYLFGYGIGRFLIDLMREEKYYIGRFNVYLIMDLSFVIISLVIMILNRKKEKKS